MTNRRSFLAGAVAAAALGSVRLSAEEVSKTSARRFEYCTFTKVLQALPAADVARKLAAMGFDGVETAVRSKGRVEPDRVTEDLPALVQTLQDAGLALTIMTTGITEVSAKQHTESVLRTAKRLGVKRFRMGYYRYDLKKPIRPQLTEFRSKFDELVAFCREIGIKPIYQNHSGKDYFGAPLWDLAEFLESHQPADVGVAFDIGHATVDGGRAWPLNFARIRPWLDSVYAKEPNWQDNKIGWGPLGEGAVDKKFYKQIKESDFSGPVSLHVEYLGSKGKDITTRILQATKREFEILRSYLE